MTIFLAANGSPFTDEDAARYKASLMASEAGGSFKVVSIDGGFGVQPADGVVETQATGTTNAQVEVNATEKPFVATLRPAWRSQISTYFVATIGLLLVIAPTWPIAIYSNDAVHELNAVYPGIWSDIQLLGFCLIVLSTLVALVRRHWRKSILTNTSLTQSTGILLFKSVSAIELSRVHVVSVKKPNIVHMLLNLGTVALSTPGSSGEDALIVDVVAPQRLAAFIRKLMDEAHTSTA